MIHIVPLCMTDITDLSERVHDLAATTSASKGPMLAPDIDLSSPAHQDLKHDATLGHASTLEHPVYDVLAHLELLFYAANDHMQAFSTLLGGEEPSWFGHIALARAVVETSSRIWLIADPTIDVLERIRRHLLERQYELAHQGHLFGGPFKALPQADYDAGKAHLDATRTSILAWAAAAGITVENGWVKGPRVRPSDLIIDVFEDDAAATGTGQAAMLAAYHYNRLSAVAHGLPSGVSIYHQHAPVPGEQAHNVLTSADVGHVALAAVTAYNAGFDRLARYFRWPHPDLLPIRWAAIHQIRVLIDQTP